MPGDITATQPPADHVIAAAAIPMAPPTNLVVRKGVESTAAFVRDAEDANLVEDVEALHLPAEEPNCALVPDLGPAPAHPRRETPRSGDGEGESCVRNNASSRWNSVPCAPKMNTSSTATAPEGKSSSHAPLASGATSALACSVACRAAALRLGSPGESWRSDEHRRERDRGEYRFYSRARPLWCLELGVRDRKARSFTPWQSRQR